MIDCAMDYVVGSVAALITGNVTPNRPRLMKRALTPTKHQPSPNVTPKSEFVEDRSIFLSPTMQKKKAIVKKSPKRIFQNPDMDTTENGEGNSSLSSPKADKVKKHLKDDLETDSVANQSFPNLKSPKNKGNNKRESISTRETNKSVNEQDVNESTPKKKKKKQNSESEITENVSIQPTDNVSTEDAAAAVKSPKKRKQRRKSVVNTDSNKGNDTSAKVNKPETPSNNEKSPKKRKNKSNSSEATEKTNEVLETTNNTTSDKKNKKRKKKAKAQATVESSENKDDATEVTNKENVQKENRVTQKKKNKKRKKSKGPQQKPEIMDTDEQTPAETQNETEEDTKSKNTVNPNAVTDKESDSEHESDNEIESENEEINKKVLEAEKPEESSDEEDEESPKEGKEKVEKKEGGGVERNTEEEVKRTLFVGNVPFSAKCKKEVKKIFSKHGQIETIRIRTVPIKDGRYTPKLAVIKNELHPERTTVNVYIKYADEESVEKALAENNTLLNENHLRVSRSSSTGAEHDPRCSVFIGNLPFAMEDEALRAKFENCGEIHSVRIIRDKKTNAGKGFGYVNFETKDGVELALALTEEDLTVKNRILRVKRCTQLTNKKKPVPTGKNQQSGGFRRDNSQGNQQRGGFRRDNSQGNQQRGGFQRDNSQGNQQRGGFQRDSSIGNQQRGGFRRDNSQGNQKGNFRGGNDQGQQRSGPPSRNNQGNRQRSTFAAGNNNQRGGFNKFGTQRNQPQKDEEGREGAHRRIMNKRKTQDGAGGDGPPNKKPKDTDQPNKEKKSRKEFVGMTAEKKKKRKIDKGQKKKKALSEILTK